MVRVYLRKYGLLINSGYSAGFSKAIRTEQMSLYNGASSFIGLGPGGHLVYFGFQVKLGAGGTARCSTQSWLRADRNDVLLLTD